MLQGVEELKKIDYIKPNCKFAYYLVSSNLVEHEDRIIRILAHYYQVDEILLPPRRPPNSSILPPQLHTFYNWLIDEIARSLVTQRQAADDQITSGDLEQFTERDEIVKDVTEKDSVPINLLAPRKRKGSSIRKISRAISNVPSEQNLSITTLNNLEHYRKYSNLLPDDSNEIETLLHREIFMHSSYFFRRRRKNHIVLIFCLYTGFIDEIQKQPDFIEKMKDPVKEVFEAVEKQMERKDRLPSSKVVKVCIIFHGAPFTGTSQTLSSALL